MTAPRAKNRHAFTLLETMLAASIGALVVFACLGIFFLMNRTDRAMEARANDQAQLERLRFVMERTFSSMLMSDEPRTLKPGEVAVATAVDLQQNLKGAPAGAGADPNGGGKDAAPEGRFSGKDRFDKGGASGSKGAGSNGADRFADKGKPGAPKGDATGQDPSQDPRTQRPPPPPRLNLAPDEVATQTMVVPVLPGQQPLPPVAPQRLEVVLFQSPVPTNNADPVDAALASIRGQHRSTSRFQLRDQADQPSPAPPATDEPEAVDAMSLPVRAVRGAFELRPQPRHSGDRTFDAEVTPASFQQQEPSGLWQVWWVPLPRLTVDGLSETFQPDPETRLTGQPQPFLVASNLKYIKWTAFQERERKTELTSTWSGELPAYVEVEAQTASGFQVNWMFEIDWANGPEVAKPPLTPAVPAGGSKDGKDAKGADGAGGAGSDFSGGSKGAGSGALGGSKGMK